MASKKKALQDAKARVEVGLTVERHDNFSRMLFVVRISRRINSILNVGVWCNGSLILSKRIGAGSIPAALANGSEALIVKHEAFNFVNTGQYRAALPFCLNSSSMALSIEKILST